MADLEARAHKLINEKSTKLVADETPKVLLARYVDAEPDLSFIGLPGRISKPKEVPSGWFWLGSGCDPDNVGRILIVQPIREDPNPALCTIGGQAWETPLLPTYKLLARNVLGLDGIYSQIRAVRPDLLVPGRFVTLGHNEFGTPINAATPFDTSVPEFQGVNLAGVYFGDRGDESWVLRRDVVQFQQ